MNAAYVNNGNAYNLGGGYGNYGSFGYGNSGLGMPGFGSPTSVGTLPNAFFAPSIPQDTVMLSGNSAPGFDFGVQDVCDCQFGNGASQEAFIVPVGDQDNPYQNYNATAMELPGLAGQSPQQALMALLANLGFTPEMIQMLQAMGINILDLIAQANGLEGMSGLQTGQDLVLPTTMPANSDAPSIVYMPAEAPQQSHGTHRPQPPVATPAPTPAPAPRRQTLADEAALAGHKQMPVARPGQVVRF